MIAHDAHLAELYAASGRSGALPGGLGPAIEAAYGEAVMPGTGTGNRLEGREARRLGVLLARDAVHHSRRFLATSDVEAELARLDAAPGERARVGFAGASPNGAAQIVAALLDPAAEPESGPFTRRRTPPRSSRPVLFDLQATQSVDQRHRGIARYVLDLAGALEDAFPHHVGGYLINPDLALPEAAERFVAAGKLMPADEVDWDAAGLLHTGSLFEMGVPLARILPPAARAAGVPWVVTFHDLIPLLMPESYLEDPGRRRRYRARAQLLRAADAILTNSRATRADAITHLGLEPGRVVAAGTGTGRQFVPPSSRADAASAAAKALPGLEPPFVFTVGSSDRRKNLEPLLEAWGLLDEGLRAGWSLVLSAIPDPSERNHLLHVAARLGISDRLCVTGFIPDDVLLLLYQGADLFVFPSLYEGYGLPVAEALACGAAVVAADTSSLPEIVGPEALFDPTDAAPMASAIAKALTDPGLRQRLLASAGRPPATWAEVAATTVETHNRVLGGTLPRVRRAGRPARTRVAVAGALPPGGGPRAGWNHDLLRELGRHPAVEVSAFADRPAGADREPRVSQAPEGVAVHPLGSLEALEGRDGPFDAVVYVLADDEHHTGALAALRRRRDGIVVARDPYLSDLYRCAHATGGLPEGVGGVIRTGYGDLVASGFDADRPLPSEEARRLGILLCRDVLAHCRRLVVTSPFHAALADLDAAASDRTKIRLAGPDPAAAADAVYEIVTSRSPV